MLYMCFISQRPATDRVTEGSVYDFIIIMCFITQQEDQELSRMCNEVRDESLAEQRNKQSCMTV